MRIIALLCSVLFIGTIARSQVTLYSEDFEGITSLSTAGSTSPNTWLTSTCAGNGITLPGTKSIYISKGGLTPNDCGATGSIQYGFDNAASGTAEMFAYSSIDAACAGTISVNFDYTITSTGSEDYAELVYSSDGGTTWITVGSTLANSPSWSNTTIALPMVLDYSAFLLGFRYTFNDSNNAGLPLAIDNITVSGTDTQSPVITCPADISTCNPVVTYADPVFSDNCSAILTQTDLSGLSSGDTFPIGITVLKYTATDAAGNSTNCTFNVEVLASPVANIPLDTLAICGVNSVFIQADPGIGEWTILSGSGTFNNQYANETGVNNLPYGNSQFIWSVTTASCGTARDTILVINSMAPSPASVQDTFFACGISQANIFTATPSSGTGLWTTLQGGIITSPTSPATNITNLSSGWNDVIWTVSAPGCPSNSDTLRILSSGNVKINNPDTTICFDLFEPFTLTGTSLGATEIGNWSFSAGNGNISSINTSSTTVSSIRIGENSIVYMVEYENCPKDSDTITIIAKYCDDFNPIFPTVITPNGDGKNDLFEIQNLEKIYPDCHVVIYNRWGSVVYESTGYVNAWDGRYKGEPLPMGTYFFKLELNDSENKIFNGPISIIH